MTPQGIKNVVNLAASGCGFNEKDAKNIETRKLCGSVTKITIHVCSFSTQLSLSMLKYSTKKLMPEQAISLHFLSV